MDERKKIVKIKNNILAILMTVLFGLCFFWLILHIQAYLPGSVIAEVVYADKDGFYGYDTLKYEDENSRQIIFHRASDKKKIMASGGSKVIVAGEIVPYKEGLSGKENSGLIIVPIWLAFTVPALSVLILFCVILAWKGYLKQKKAYISLNNTKVNKDKRSVGKRIINCRESDEKLLYYAEAYEYNCKILSDGSTARKQCLKLFEDHAVLYYSEWMDSAQLHEYEHIQKQKVKYTQSVYVPYENVETVKYSANGEFDFKVTFIGKDFRMDLPTGQKWFDYLEIDAREMKPDELINIIYKQTPLPDPKKFVDMIKNLRHKTSTGIATVEFMKESFPYSDYGANEGFPTMYFINDVNITDLLQTDRVISLPYGIYKVYAIAYTYTVRKNMPDVKGRKMSNVLELILNDEYSKIQIKTGRAIDSGEGRHLTARKSTV